MLILGKKYMVGSKIFLKAIDWRWVIAFLINYFFGLRLLGVKIASSDAEGNSVDKYCSMAAVRNKIRKDQLKRQRRRGQEGQQLYTPEFSDCMVCTPNSKIKSSSSVADWLTLTLHLPESG